MHFIQFNLLDLVSFYLSLSLYVYGLVSVLFSYACFEYILGKLSGLFRFNNYPLVEKAYSIMLHGVGVC